MNECDNMALLVTEFESQAEACFVGRAMVSAHGLWGLESVAMTSAHGPWGLRSAATGRQGRILKDNTLFSQTGSVTQDEGCPAPCTWKKQQETMRSIPLSPPP